MDKLWRALGIASIEQEGSGGEGGSGPGLAGGGRAAGVLESRRWAGVACHHAVVAGADVAAAAG